MTEHPEGWLPDADYRDTYTKVPRATVDLIINTPNGRVVFIQRAIPPRVGEWHFPGGGLRVGEDYTTAARRVARDEVGLEVEVLGALCVIAFARSSSPQGRSVGPVLLCRSTTEQPRGSWQGRAVATPAALAPAPMLPEHAAALQLATPGPYRRVTGGDGPDDAFEVLRVVA